MSLISPVMARRERELPRHMVVAVTDTRVYLMGATRWGVGEEFRSWDRAHVKASAERSHRSVEVWMQPPGSTPGIELRSSSSPASEAVVDALTHPLPDGRS
jgi:hypothetical protein